MCFQSDLWKMCFKPEHCLELTKIYRQHDVVFTSMLNNIRIGTVSDAELELLSQLKRPLCHHDGILPTMLKALNVNVDALNYNQLTQLQKPIITFQAIDTGKEPHLSKLQSTCRIELKVQLCEGAQVMLIRNMQSADKLVNGSRGIIEGFSKGMPLVILFV